MCANKFWTLHPVWNRSQWFYSIFPSPLYLFIGFVFCAHESDLLGYYSISEAITVNILQWGLAEKGGSVRKGCQLWMGVNDWKGVPLQYYSFGALLLLLCNISAVCCSCFTSPPRSSWAIKNHSSSTSRRRIRHSVKGTSSCWGRDEETETADGV